VFGGRTQNKTFYNELKLNWTFQRVGVQTNNLLYRGGVCIFFLKTWLLLRDLLGENA